MDFKEQLFEANLSVIPRAAEFFGVTEQTIYRWIKNGAPHVAMRALELRSGRDPHRFGWRIDRNRIVRPDRRVFELWELKEWETTIWKEKMLAYEQGRQHGLMQRPPQLDLFKP